MKRYKHDLSHHSFMAGKIGRLMTITQMPIVAGDSFSVNLKGIFRLSPLRRNLTLDAMVDIFCFYLPYRHIYSNFTAFIEGGINESETLATVAAAGDVQYIGVNAINQVGYARPLHQIAGYNRIWNRYFRHPSDDTAIVADTKVVTGTSDESRFGYNCCHLKRMWNTGADPATKPAAADREVAVAAGVFDIVDLAQIKARYKTEIDREWFAQRYTDLLGKTWGSGVNIDADERPQLCGRSSNWLSGYDVDGTDDASLGSFSGKAVSAMEFTMPRKFFPEHGTMWIMALVRFPPVHSRESHYFEKIVQPSYAELAGDPDVISAQDPVDLDVFNIFAPVTAPAGVTVGMTPYAQWYREHPHVVHLRYDVLQGFPFLNTTPTALTRWYHRDNEYNNVFQTDQLGHWQSQVTVNVDAMRVVPPAIRSIYAGVN